MSTPSKHHHNLNVPFSSTLVESNEPPEEEEMMALLALSHTMTEHQLYLAMLSEVSTQASLTGQFGVRRLMRLTGLSSYSSIRRGCIGLISKRSIEKIDNVEDCKSAIYRVFKPQDIFERRCEVGIAPFPQEISSCKYNEVFCRVIKNVVGRYNLSRRESLVALFCAKGLSNIEIGDKLKITDKTVKYHLKHIFIKLGIKRRTELIERLL
jgi:ATP/maltotriose-dependent transcriptional regulator MalT